MGWRPFPYVPLSGTQIRYITVHPSNGAGGKVQCTLHQAALEDVAFNALSYAWGDPSITETIILSGKPFRATTNLVACLKQLATRADGTILWVDAVCINQNDVDERSAQVQRMKHIYSAARSVIAWLGPSTRLSRIGVQRLQNIDLAEAVSLQDSTEERDQKQRIQVLNRLLSHDGDPGLRDILLRPYWYRTWVIQEIALGQLRLGQLRQADRARPEVCLLCGEDEIPLHKLIAFILMLNDHSRVHDLRRVRTLQRSLLDFAIMFQQFYTDIADGALRMIMSIGKPIQPLQESIFLYSSFRCSDDKDRIYALLGISSDTEGILPDYTKSTATVYSDYVHRLIRKDDRLDVLSLACFHSERGPLHASWIPDWRHGAPDAHGYAGNARHMGNYSCSKGLPVSSHPWSLDSTTGELRLAGACLDTITSLSKDMPANIHEASDEVPGSIQNWMRMVHQRFGKGQLETTLWLGLDGGCYPLNDNEPLAEACRRTLVADCDNFATGPVRSPHMMVLPWEETQQNPAGFEYIHGPTDEAYVKLMTRRRLAITSKGWIGMVQREAEVGDHVAVLIGASVPFILRKAEGGTAGNRDNEYTLIGDAYIHGLMHGKGLDMAEVGEIVLR